MISALRFPVARRGRCHSGISSGLAKHKSRVYFRHPPSGSHTILVFHTILTTHSDGDPLPLTKASNKKSQFSTTRFVSEMIQDRAIVTTGCQKEPVCDRNPESSSCAFSVLFGRPCTTHYTEAAASFTVFAGRCWTGSLYICAAVFNI